MLTIRSALSADVPEVLPMVRAIAALHEQWDAARYGLSGDPGLRYEQWLIRRATDPRSVFLVAERPPDTQPEVPEGPGGPGRTQPRLVAFLIATAMKEMEMYKVGEYGFIHDLWVEPAYRHEGVGRQMTTLALERFREMGVGQVRLDVWHGNSAARRLYESCGMRVGVVEMLVELPKYIDS
jgi:ribosomal protein S18 acetylase RimI-like enzyme